MLSLLFGSFGLSEFIVDIKFTMTKLLLILHTYFYMYTQKHSKFKFDLKQSIKSHSVDLPLQIPMLTSYFFCEKFGLIKAPLPF